MMAFLFFCDAEFHRNVVPCILVGLAIVLLLFCGVSGRSPEQDAQPLLRVAAGGLERMVVAGRNPAGVLSGAPTLPFTV